MHIRMLTNSIFDGLVTHLLSLPGLFIEILSRDHVKEREKKTSLNDLKFGTFCERVTTFSQCVYAIRMTGAAWDVWGEMQGRKLTTAVPATDT